MQENDWKNVYEPSVRLEYLCYQIKSGFPLNLFAVGTGTGTRKRNEKISFHYFDLSGKEKTFCKQAINLTIKHFMIAVYKI